MPEPRLERLLLAIDQLGVVHSRLEHVLVGAGPLRARVRATHPDTRGLRFEITVTLTAGSADVDVGVRVFADLPPKTGEAKVNGWQFPLEIHEGYWLELVPGFAVATVLRDYPFGVEPSRKSAFHALSWLDLMAADGSGRMAGSAGAAGMPLWSGWVGTVCSRPPALGRLSAAAHTVLRTDSASARCRVRGGQVVRAAYGGL